MKNKTTIAIIGCDAPNEIVERLSASGFYVLTIPKDERLPLPVRSHPDMLMFSVDNYVFCSEKYFKTASDYFNVLSEYGYTIIPCDVNISDNYPYDIAFNTVKCKNSLYGNTEFTAREIVNYVTSKGLDAVCVKQGYTKCSTALLGERAAITADSGIAKALKLNGVSVLKIRNSPDAVSLEGYDYGFIGGACGCFESTVYFCGDIRLHPQGEEIVSFCRAAGFSVCCLSDKKLTDIGGILFFPYSK